jgi:hypothetical protein
VSPTAAARNAEPATAQRETTPTIATHTGRGTKKPNEHASLELNDSNAA